MKHDRHRKRRHRRERRARPLSFAAVRFFPFKAFKASEPLPKDLKFPGFVLIPGASITRGEA